MQVEMVMLAEVVEEMGRRRPVGSSGAQPR